MQSRNPGQFDVRTVITAQSWFLVTQEVMFKQNVRFVVRKPFSMFWKCAEYGDQKRTTLHFPNKVSKITQLHNRIIHSCAVEPPDGEVFLMPHDYKNSLLWGFCFFGIGFWSHCHAALLFSSCSAEQRKGKHYVFQRKRIWQEASERKENAGSYAGGTG